MLASFGVIKVDTKCLNSFKESMGDNFVWVKDVQDDGGEIIIDGQRYNLDEILQDVDNETITRSEANTIETTPIPLEDVG